MKVWDQMEKEKVFKPRWKEFFLKAHLYLILLQFAAERSDKLGFLSLCQSQIDIKDIDSN